MPARIFTLNDRNGNNEDYGGNAVGEENVSERVHSLPVASASEPTIYWESQGKDRMCGLHALNSLLQVGDFHVFHWFGFVINSFNVFHLLLLQGPILTEADLSTVAIFLDDEERKLIYSTSGLK